MCCVIVGVMSTVSCIQSLWLHTDFASYSEIMHGPLAGRKRKQEMGQESEPEQEHNHKNKH